MLLHFVGIRTCSFFFSFLCTTHHISSLLSALHVSPLLTTPLLFSPLHSTSHHSTPLPFSPLSYLTFSPLHSTPLHSSSHHSSSHHSSSVSLRYQEWSNTSVSRTPTGHGWLQLVPLNECRHHLQVRYIISHSVYITSCLHHHLNALINTFISQLSLPYLLSSSLTYPLHCPALAFLHTFNSLSLFSFLTQSLSLLLTHSTLL